MSLRIITDVSSVPNFLLFFKIWAWMELDLYIYIIRKDTDIYGKDTNCYGHASVTVV